MKSETLQFGTKADLTRLATEKRFKSWHLEKILSPSLSNLSNIFKVANLPYINSVKIKFKCFSEISSSESTVRCQHKQRKMWEHIEIHKYSSTTMFLVCGVLKLVW